MPVAFSGGHRFIPTRSILVAVQSLLSGLTLTTPVTGAAFATVNIYGHEHLTQAIKDLLTFDDRIAFIVPTRIDHATRQDGRIQITTRRLEFVVLCSDRVYGDFAAAAQIGTSTSPANPGAMNLGELIVENLIGQQLAGYDYILVEAGVGEPFQVEDKKLGRARDCWAQTFMTDAGQVRVDWRRPGGTLPNKFAA